MDTLVTGEAVRLVIWDLDDTLWRGTLDDLGTLEHIQAHYEIVRKLTRRGIINSVCSKNDFDTAKSTLIEQGIWDELIFPSINWTSKGPRLLEIIKAIQLRPESVLFIDDNETNLAEAQALVRGIQIARPSEINSLLDDPRLKSSNNIGEIRLAHYKVLKRRHEGLLAANGDIEAFLRASDIKVELDYNIEDNIDRAIELINRTNQLNFTKVRLSTNLVSAREELRRTVFQNDVKAALIKVRDLHGDHGYCGLYVLEKSGNSPRLKHFCFSCRVIGMGIEQSIYAFLRRPDLVIVGETASDPTFDVKIDWIEMTEAKANK